MSKRAKIEVGDVVRLRKGVTPFGTNTARPGIVFTKQAIVEELLKDVPGGVRVGSYLGGARYWNVADLAKTGRRSA